MTQTIYIAGGFRGGWRNYIQKVLKDSNFKILDPLLDKELDSKGRRKQLSFKEYTEWDKWAIREWDICFVYAEKTNPGAGYIAEIGYAHGLGKKVVLVREKNHNYIPDKYLNFIDCMADKKFSSFKKGVKYLKSLSNE